MFITIPDAIFLAVMFAIVLYGYELDKQLKYEQYRRTMRLYARQIRRMR